MMNIPFKLVAQQMTKSSDNLFRKSTSPSVGRQFVATTQNTVFPYTIVSILDFRYLYIQIHWKAKLLNVVPVE